MSVRAGADHYPITGALLNDEPFYHVTPAENLESILMHGLVPNIGARSADLGEWTPRVYLFISRDACENALCNWLGEAFEELEHGLVILELEPASITGESEAAYEVACADVVSPLLIRRVLDEAFEPLALASPSPSRSAPRMGSPAPAKTPEVNNKPQREKTHANAPHHPVRRAGPGNRYGERMRQPHHDRPQPNAGPASSPAPRS